MRAVGGKDEAKPKITAVVWEQAHPIWIAETCQQRTLNDVEKQLQAKFARNVLQPITDRSLLIKRTTIIDYSCVA